MEDAAGFGQPLDPGEVSGRETLGTRVSRRDGVVWLAVAGELDAFTAPKLRSAIRDANVAGDESLVFDLRGMEFMDSSGLAVILAAHERSAQGDGNPVRLVIRGAAPIEALFDTIGAGEYLNLIDDPTELAAIPSR